MSGCTDTEEVSPQAIAVQIIKLIFKSTTNGNTRSTNTSRGSLLPFVGQNEVFEKSLLTTALKHTDSFTKDAANKLLWKMKRQRSCL